MLSWKHRLAPSMRKQFQLPAVACTREESRLTLSQVRVTVDSHGSAARLTCSRMPGGTSQAPWSSQSPCSSWLCPDSVPTPLCWVLRGGGSRGCEWAVSCEEGAGVGTSAHSVVPRTRVSVFPEFTSSSLQPESENGEPCPRNVTGLDTSPVMSPVTVGGSGHLPNTCVLGRQVQQLVFGPEGLFPRLLAPPMRSPGLPTGQARDVGSTHSPFPPTPCPSGTALCLCHCQSPARPHWCPRGSLPLPGLSRVHPSPSGPQALLLCVITTPGSKGPGCTCLLNIGRRGRCWPRQRNM